MVVIAEFIHYLIVAFIVGINSIAVGIGEGIANGAAIDALSRQPSAKGDIVNAAILGMALIETSAIVGITISVIILFGTSGVEKTLYFGIAEIGIALAICLSGFAIGLASALPTRAACMSIARQPFSGKKITQFMLITQTIIQTPIIFGFIIAIFIKGQAANATTISDSLRLLASGLAIGLGSIGPIVGLAKFGATACEGLGVNRKSSNHILSFTFLSEAIIETPIIFALIISFTLLFIVKGSTNPITGIAYLSAALCIGLGTIGPGISSGNTAAAACKQIARKPEQYSLISKISMFGQGLIDTSAIYSLVVAFMLILLGR
ncbi:hypothetical protein KAH94_01385 [bacterium]|nr:hypothetical protein [bacterium]